MRMVAAKDVRRSRLDLRFALIFAGACFAGLYLHEIGHAAAGWVQGVAVVPTPAKEYLLRDQVEWSQEVWIALGGVAGTTLLTVGTLLWYVRRRGPWSDAVLAGVLLPPCLYTFRFLVVGRGHDAVEWQAAQAALGVDPAGHVVDILFLCLFLAGFVAWILHRRPRVEFVGIVKFIGFVLGGIVFIILLQVTNNILFDRFFPKTTTLDVPAGLDPR